MAKSIELYTPIEIDGERCSMLEYDTEEITINHLASAEAAAKRKASNLVALAEFDYTFHFYVGAQAIIAVNPSIDITDLERIKGRDIMQLIEVGRFFTMRSDDAEESSSEEPSETSPESSQLPSATSKDGESKHSSPTTEKP